VTPTSATIGISSSAKFVVAFNPTASGASSANVVFYHNAPSHRDTVKLSGNGILKVPVFTATPTSINFSAVLVGQWKKDSITVKNSGYDSLIISSVFTGDTTFVVTPTSARLDSMASQKFYVTYYAYVPVNKAGSVIFVDNTSEAQDTAKLKGKGLNIVTIGEARKDVNSDGIADHSVSLDTLAITGIVTTPNMGASASQTSYFMQDGTGGIDAFAFGLTSTNYLKGDSVIVIGTVAQFRGLVEFTPLVLNDIYFKDVAHVSIPAPKHLTLHQFATSAENFEGQLIEIDTLYRAKGYWPGPSVGNVSVYLTNASRADTGQMFLDLDAHIGGFSDTTTYPINVVGTVSQFSSAATVYNNGYEISPRDSNDISRTRIAPTVTIAEARKDANSDLIADHSVSHDTLTIYGVVTTPNMGASASQTSYFIQDATAGVDVFAFSLTSTVYAKGDSVMVTGTVAQFRGLVEFTPLVLDDAHFMIIKHNAAMPAARHLTLHQFVQNAESYEGQLVEIDTLYKATGTWPATAANTSIYLTNASKSDTAQMFLDLDAHIGGTKEPAYPINVIGIVSQFTSAATVYNNGYEISPRDTADFIHTPGTAGVLEQFSGIPKDFELYNSYPNPFNPSTTIQYGLPQQSKVNLKVYSVLGQEIATLVDDIQNASYHRVQWNGRDNNGVQVSSGVYFFRIVAQPLDGKASPFTQVRKMMLMK
jgi:DNA/RNA endonuclease YhcR with UshA esterase domain